MSAYLAIALSVSAWGTWPLWLRASSVEGLAKGFWTLVLIAGPALLLSLVGPFRGVRPTRRDLRVLAVMGVAGAVNQLSYFASMDHTTIARAAMAHYLAPVLVAALAPFVLRERFEGRVALALVAALVGLGLLLGEAPATAPPRDVLGVALALASAIGYAVILLGAKRLSPGISPLFVVGAHLGTAAVVSLPYLLVTTNIGVPIAELGWLAAASMIAGLVPAAVFYGALAKVPAQHAAVLTYLEPVTSALLAWLVLGEPLGAQGVVGAACVIAAGLAVVWRR